MKPTDQQQQAIDLARKGENFAIEALAGTGKTSTLVEIAKTLSSKRGFYFAFNKVIKLAAVEKFPKNVECRTINSMAYTSILPANPWIKSRMKAERIKSRDIAHLLDIRSFSVPNVTNNKTKVLSPRRLAGLTMQMVKEFCKSDSESIGPEHLPFIMRLDRPGEDFIQRRVATKILPYAKEAWRNLTSPDGLLPFMHDHYLKMWQLTNPVLRADFILVDEAQDLNAVMCSVVAKQRDMQIIGVGDSRQQIYEWNGAVNALKSFGGKKVWLTKSFRFGPEIAAVANHSLRLAGEEIEVEGVGGPSRVCSVEVPDAILCRTNFGTLQEVIRAHELGKKVHLAGKQNELKNFAIACRHLMQGRVPDHKDLSCFEDWEDLKDYVDTDPQGADLKSVVGLVEKVGVEKIIKTVQSCCNEFEADLVISTAHKSKGLEWRKVCLNTDMMKLEESANQQEPPRLKMSQEEMRLLYVAITRAKSELDISNLSPLAEIFGGTSETQHSVIGHYSGNSGTNLVAETKIELSSSVESSNRGQDEVPSCFNIACEKNGVLQGHEYKYCPYCGTELQRSDRPTASEVMDSTITDDRRTNEASNSKPYVWEDGNRPVVDDKCSEDVDLGDTTHSFASFVDQSDPDGVMLNDEGFDLNSQQLEPSEAELEVQEVPLTMDNLLEQGQILLSNRCRVSLLQDWIVFYSEREDRFPPDEIDELEEVAEAIDAKKKQMQSEDLEKILDEKWERDQQRRPSEGWAKMDYPSSTSTSENQGPYRNASETIEDFLDEFERILADSRDNRCASARGLFSGFAFVSGHYQIRKVVERILERKVAITDQSETELHEWLAILGQDFLDEIRAELYDTRR